MDSDYGKVESKCWLLMEIYQKKALVPASEIINGFCQHFVPDKRDILRKEGLEYLLHFGLIEKEGDAYRNTSIGKEVLQQYFSQFVMDSIDKNSLQRKMNRMNGDHSRREMADELDSTLNFFRELPASPSLDEKIKAAVNNIFLFMRYVAQIDLIFGVTKTFLEIVDFITKVN